MRASKKRSIANDIQYQKKYEYFIDSTKHIRDAVGEIIRVCPHIIEVTSAPDGNLTIKHSLPEDAEKLVNALKEQQLMIFNKIFNTGGDHAVD